jgi:hypothetical protein
MLTMTMTMTLTMTMMSLQTLELMVVMLLDQCSVHLPVGSAGMLLSWKTIASDMIETMVVILKRIKRR